MPKRSSQREPITGTPWPTRRRLVIAGLVGAVLAAASSAFSLAMVTQRSQPALAMQIAPVLPKAAARMADLELAQVGSAGPQGARAARIKGFARKSLEASALSSPGLRQLAMLERNPARRQALYGLAIEVTRRDPIALIQASEYYLKANRLDPAMDNFDRALRVSSDTDPVVFSVLLSAVRDPGVRTKVRALVARNPVWGERLVRWSLQNPNSLAGFSQVVSAFPRGAGALEFGYGQRIVDQLSVQRQYPEAFATYAAYARRRPDPSNFATGALPPLDWSLIDNYESGARPLGSAQDGVEIFADPSRIGDAARLVVRAPPGKRALGLKLGQVEGIGGTLGLEVVCLLGSSERGLARLGSPIRPGELRFEYIVPPTGCPYHWLKLTIAAGDVATRAVVEQVRLGPAA